MVKGEMENRETILIDKDGFRTQIMNWVYSMQIAPAQFKMNEGADSTIFTSCFALFIFDLFGHVDTWAHEEKDIWIDYINSFQDENSGYFIPDNFNGKLNTKPVQQLTCFCLSALDILDASPKYRFSFLNQWPQPDDVKNYLKEIGCFKGKPTTGNMAMFLAIFLTHQYEKYNDDSAIERLNSWFYWHDKNQKKSTGFWGNSLKNRYYAGFQNAFHQLVIYNYWNRPLSCYTKIVDIVISLQDYDGHFAPIPGGGGCWDYDAADILINYGFKSGYRKKDIESVLIRLFFDILKNQNKDGGFCNSRKKPLSIIQALNNKKFTFSGHNPYVWYYKLKATNDYLKRNARLTKTHWTMKGRLWHQSDLWNTWFRCLTLAEISEMINFDHPLKRVNWKFHKAIGLGHFRTVNGKEGSN